MRDAAEAELIPWSDPRWVLPAADAFTPDLARALSNQSNALAGVGRYEEALPASTEAVATYRALAAARPYAFTTDLGVALNNQSVRLAELGRYEEALLAATEALDLFRWLAVGRAVFVPEVARLLVLQARRHADLGGFASAVSADREAVSVYTTLFSTDPDRYRDGYEQAIQSLAQHLKGLGCAEQQIADELDRVAPEGG